MSQDKIIDRIKKLFRLAESSNMHEAANAAARAAELMQKHEIQEAMLGEAQEDEVVTLLLHKSDHKVKWRGIVADGIADALGCKMLYLGGNVIIMTPKHKTEVIQCLYDHITREINYLADKEYDNSIIQLYESAKKFKNSFRVAAAITIAQRLEDEWKEKRKEYQGTTALVRVDQSKEQVEDAVKEKFGENIKPVAPVKVSSHSGVIAGKRAGQEINLRKSVGAGVRNAPLGTYEE